MQRLVQGLDVVRRNEEAGLAVLHGLGHAADVGGDHRQAGEHRFEQDERKPFEAGRQNEDVECG